MSSDLLHSNLRKMKDWHIRAVDCAKAGEIELGSHAEDIAAILGQLTKERGRAVFVGEFGSGKTCLANGVLGRSILPVHLDECTAIPTLVRHAEQEVLLIPDGSEGYSPASEAEKKSYFELRPHNIPEILKRFIRNQRLLIYEYPICEKIPRKWDFVDLPGLSSTSSSIVESSIIQIAEADLVLAVVNLKLGISASLSEFLDEYIPENAKIVFIGTYADRLPPKQRDAALEGIRAYAENTWGDKLIACVKSQMGALCDTEWDDILPDLEGRVLDGITKVIREADNMLDALKLANSHGIGQSNRNDYASEPDEFEGKCREVLESTILELSSCIGTGNDKQHTCGYHLNPHKVRKLEATSVGRLKKLYEVYSGGDDDCYKLLSVYSQYNGILLGMLGTCRGICWRYEIGEKDRAIGSDIKWPLLSILLNRRITKENMEKLSGLSINDRRRIFGCNENISWNRARTVGTDDQSVQDEYLSDLIREGESILTRIKLSYG